MADMERRELIKLLGLAPVVGALAVSPVELERIWRDVAAARRRGRTFQPKFFTTHEWETVRILADMIIPADERSGSATDAGVPEFMDFVLRERETDRGQTAIRGGLAWLDTECRERFGRNFMECEEGERRAVLDDIAWPERAPPELRYGVVFFNRFRNLTASGFWSSKMGIADLEYIGNTALSEWVGCPEEQLRRLGVRYGE